MCTMRNASTLLLLHQYQFLVWDELSLSVCSYLMLFDYLICLFAAKDPSILN